jgi:tRNA (adenine57-N1/adenine58-N1)-methyltransferase
MVSEVQPDRIVLDLPQPWDVVDAAVESLQGGGVFLAYVPTVPQMAQTVEALRASDAFVELMSFEAFLRTWNIDGRSVRPDHRMIGHTGFVTVARKVLPA